MIRLTGMSSGLDTESMITELMSAYNTTKQKKVSTMTKYSWKMDTWSSLNKKISSFYSKSLSNLRFSSAYSSKKTTVSDSTKATVTASNDAITGSQSLAIKQLAQSGYLTGGKLATKDGSTLSSESTLASLGYSGADTSIDVNGTSISISSSSKISDVVSALQGAGVNASFDSTNSRIFVSAKNSGLDGDFSISANDTNGIKALADLGLYTGVSSSASAANATYASYVTADADGNYSLNSNADAAVSKLAEEKQTAYETKANTAKAALDENTYYTDAATAASAKGLSDDAYYDDINSTLTAKSEELQSQLTSLQSDIDAAQAKVDRLAELQGKSESDLTDEEKTELATLEAENSQTDADGNTVTLQSKLDALNTQKTDLETEKSSVDGAISNLASFRENTAKADADSCKSEAESELLAKGIAAAKSSDISADAELSAYVAASASSTAVRLNGQDATIYLNGAEFTSTSNSFSINGLTINCTETTGLTEDGKSKLASGAELSASDYNTVTLSTGVDTDGIYDTIKSFLKEYNTLIKEMDTMYNADSASDYDVLSDDEKDSMSDSEIEAWETKIKDSLLRRDSDLNSLISTLKNGMSASYEINGSTYSLATFGIETLSYFLAEDNEKGIYHIYGDEDDADTSGEEDKLKAAIASDPEAVQEFFQKLSTNLYSELQKKASATTMSSYGKFYNDKEMSTRYSSYKTALSDYEDKLADIEDKYYSQFSAMETALSKLNSQSSAFSSMLG